MYLVCLVCVSLWCLALGGVKETVIIDPINSNQVLLTYHVDVEFDIEERSVSADPNLKPYLRDLDGMSPLMYEIISNAKNASGSISVTRGSVDLEAGSLATKEGE